METNQKSLAEMVDEANKMLGTKISYKLFEPVKHAFTKGSALSFDEIVEAFRNYPLISQAEILRLFKKECLAEPDVKISSQKIFRPHLITIVENIEKWTGIEMCNDNNRQGPLVDYDDKGVTISDIAYYFSTGFKTDKGKVAEIRKTFLAKAES